MTDYTKVTDFSAKDPLASGDPEKLAVGADVDAEFDAISVMSATKEDKVNKGAASGYCPLNGASYVPDANLSPDIMRLDTAQTVTSAKGDAWTTLTDAATISIDASVGNSFFVTLGGNRTISNPTSPEDGQCIVLVVKQDATGSRTLSWGTQYKWAGGTPPVLSTGAAAVDMFTGKYYAALSAWYFTTSALNLS